MRDSGINHYETINDRIKINYTAQNMKFSNSSNSSKNSRGHIKKMETIVERENNKKNTFKNEVEDVLSDVVGFWLAATELIRE